MSPRISEKFELNSQLQTAQILTNNVQMLILWLSYFITTVSACDVVTKLVVTQHYGLVSMKLLENGHFQM